VKILILRFSSIGDIILTTPVVRCIKKQIPDAEIHYCTKKNFVSILENNPYIDKIIPLENSLKELKQKLKAEKYDYILDLHNNLRTLRIKLSFLFSSKISSFNKINIKKLQAVKFKKLSSLPDIHIVDRYFSATKKLGVINDNLGLDYFLPTIFSCKNLPDEFAKNYAAFVIGAQFQTKQLPVSKAIEICQKSPKQKFVVIGGKEDFQRGKEIAEACSNVLNVCGEYSLDGSAFLVKNARLVISNDTGLMHIAAAFNKKIISIWGNTIPEFGMYPYMPQHPENYSIQEVKDLWCRPCSKIGFKTCPKGHFNCMMEQNVAEIVAEIKSFESV
jgi:ADP-heptose:LPS heptosyltransferase